MIISKIAILFGAITAISATTAQMNYCELTLCMAIVIVVFALAAYTNK